MKEFIKCVIMAFIAVIAVMYILFNAVIQESYRLAPPTAEEIADNPKLAEYMP